ncbi:hypothetical protein [Marinigracilibium pacificum]|uniref:Uncharacterized protein n=1 Tax=Marinigracilibium pacificum TaxID=2729599 RepID=A0A848J2E7_9BACT|nr:hypothetical protein [Marinigracilibium pacificum]NMM49498.1 hypothetical protein [Marinigracilibium pacificum]
MNSSDNWLLPKEKTEFRNFLHQENISTSEKHSGLKSTVEKFRTLFSRANLYLYYLLGFTALLFIPLSLITKGFQTGICISLTLSIFIANWSVVHYPKGFLPNHKKKMQRSAVKKHSKTTLHH